MVNCSINLNSLVFVYSFLLPDNDNSLTAQPPKYLKVDKADEATQANERIKVQSELLLKDVFSFGVNDVAQWPRLYYPPGKVLIHPLKKVVTNQ